MARDEAIRDNTTQDATAKATNCEPSVSTAFLNATFRDATDAMNTTQHDPRALPDPTHDTAVRLPSAFSVETGYVIS